MPHMPRPDIQGTQEPHDKEAVPVNRDDESALQKKVGIGKISLKNWEVDPLKVYKQMFAIEPEKDEAGFVHHGSRKQPNSGVKDDTGNVVHARPAGRDT